MKKILILSITLIICYNLRAQFDKPLAEARTAYSSGKLDDARFAMQQMLQELDIITGKEILKALPLKMQDQAANNAKDNVSGASGFAGVVVHRDYGKDDKNIDLEVISNSPFVSSLNALLSMPMLGSTGDNKIIRINGYKGLLQKHSDDKDKPDYELQLPLNNTLITLKAPGYAAEDVIKMANALPIEQIAKLAQ